MNICMVSLSGLPHHVSGVSGAYGGAEAQAAVLADALIGRGHAVSMVVTGYLPEMESRRRTRIPLINAYHASDGIPGLRFFPRWRGLHRALGSVKPDLVFQMCATAATGQAAFYARRAGCAFVYATASDADVVPSRVRLGRRDLRLYHYGLPRAHRVITQHEDQAQLLKTSYGVDSTPIPFGIRLPEAPGVPAREPTVLWLGSLRSVKRPDRWLDLAERMPGVRFVMAGGRTPSEPGVFDATRDRAASLANVSFLGPVEDLEAVLHGAWVLLNTSDVEGFPTTFLEAWSREIPTVSFFDPGGRVRDHGLGILGSSLEELQRGLTTFLENRAERDRVGAHARSFVLREHAPEAVAAKVEVVFEEAWRLSQEPTP